MAIFYLDIDDEITSAAARIRGTQDLVVVLVLPAGSRIATSRINFRLLAREAQQRSRRLSIVAPDASARALAATAGLPAFASTMEYESSLAQPAGVGEEAAAPATVPAVGVAVQPPAPAPDAGPAVAQARRLTPDELAARDVALAGGVAGGASGSTPSSASSVRDVNRDAGRLEMPEPHATAARLGPSTGLGPARDQAATPRPRRRRRTALLVGLLVVAFLGVAGGAAAYLLLPSASIVLTIRSAPLAPVEFVVTADPAATALNATAGVVPALILDLPLSASGTFKATGKRVSETAATGSVQWSNRDFLHNYLIKKGSVVSTVAGTKFVTSEDVLLPQAQISGPCNPSPCTLTPSSRGVGITAANPGTDGNVAAGTIRQVPSAYDPSAIKVTNPARTTGGTHQEFPKVIQKDVTAALASLGKQLDAKLVAGAAAPAGLAAGSTAFPETATRGAATPTVDPTTLVDQEVAQFDLGVTATGTIVTVDQAPILALGEARLAAAVPADRDMVAGSALVTVGPGTVDGQRVRFGVTARAESAPRVDESALRTQLKGRSPTEARAILGAYGDATVTLWPGWATTIPTLDARVDLRVEGVAGVSPTPAPSASTAP
jgi:hypothetical protein